MSRLDKLLDTPYGGVGDWGLAEFAFILCAKINQILLNLHGGDILGRGPFEITGNKQWVGLVENDCGGFIAPALVLKREPSVRRPLNGPFAFVR